MGKEDKNSKFELAKVEEIIKQRILTIRGYRVMVDTDLAELYGVSTKVLNQAIKRNIERFPEDFMFQLSEDEYENLRSQIVTSSLNYGGRRYLPYVFTEHGVAMLSSVLNSVQAIQMNIFIVRAFIKMRESLDKYNDLSRKIGELEVNQIKDRKILVNLYSALKHLLDKPIEPKGKIGFVTDK